MQFACNAFCFPYDDIATNAGAVAAAGFTGIEPSLGPDVLSDPDAVDAIADAADSHGLEIPTVLGGDFWGSPISASDADTREEGLELGETLIEAAARLGADVVLVIPGIVDEETRDDVAYANALEGVRRLASAADEHGVYLGVENVWNGMLQSPMEFRDFIDAAADAGPVGAYFDVGNVVRFGHPVHWIEILGERIVAVHVKGFDATIDNRDGFTYPLAGTIDWPAVTEALETVGYDGWVTPEVQPYEALPERTFEHLYRDLGAIFG